MQVQRLYHISGIFRRQPGEMLRPLGIGSQTEPASCPFGDGKHGEIGLLIKGLLQSQDKGAEVDFDNFPSLGGKGEAVLQHTGRKMGKNSGEEILLLE